MAAETTFPEAFNHLHETGVGLSAQVASRRHLHHLLSRHPNAVFNPGRKTLIHQAIQRGDAFAARSGFLFTYTRPASTGRSPRDTYIVRTDRNEAYIDWDSSNNQPMAGEVFESLWQDAIQCLGKKDTLYVTDRTIGADPTYALPVRTVTDTALTALFTLNMFRPLPVDLENSVLADQPFMLLVLPNTRLDSDRYQGKLRKLADGRTSDMAIVMDFDKRLGLVWGSAYGGSVKKLMFTVMNYYLPFVDVLPLHCSANEDKEGNPALFLGLSGTGKTSLSADPSRALLGDDEHGWSERGVANFENGCYAKLINLSLTKEPEIFKAVFHEAPYDEHGAIVENAMVYPDGSFDLADDRLTPNSRASYPLSFLTNFKPSAMGPHPKSIIFLTADANGVLPPISRLETDQAMLWFLMGYTSKVAGTEAGILDPVSIFSRFFGEPFMPLVPNLYTKLLGEKLAAQSTHVFLVNTGWIGGPWGVGHRIDIDLTRAMVNTALEGKLDGVACVEDRRFHLMVPKACPGIPAALLSPKQLWVDGDLYEKRACSLAEEFCRHFDQAYGDKAIPITIRSVCPGK